MTIEELKILIADLLIQLTVANKLIAELERRIKELEAPKEEQ